MNLQQTVSKILGREVSLEEAMNFANEQYGVLCQYNREFDKKANPKKETRVYVVSVDDITTTAYDIQNWKDFERHHNQLLNETKEFIKVAEELGNVYTLEGFQNALNLEELFLDNSWVYITNNY